MSARTELLRELAEMAPLIDRLRSDGLRRRDLTLPRLRLLLVLHERGPLRSGELASCIGVTPRAITGLVDGLSARGYVERVPDPVDRRAALVTLTTAGTETCVDVQRTYDAFTGELLGDFDGAQVAAALEVVRRARANLDLHLNGETRPDQEEA